MVQSRQRLAVVGKNQRSHEHSDGEYLIRSLDDPGLVKLPLSPARYMISTGGFRGSWCLQLLRGRPVARGVQSNADESRGADMASRRSCQHRARVMKSYFPGLGFLFFVGLRFFGLLTSVFVGVTSRYSSARFRHRSRRVAYDVHSLSEQSFLRKVVIHLATAWRFAGEVVDYHPAFDPSVCVFLSASFVPIPRVNVRKAIALASVDSTITTGLSVVRFPSSVFVSVVCFCIFPGAS